MTCSSSLPDFSDRERAERLAEEGVRSGHLRVFFNGRKLKGGWTLQRTRGKGTKSQWLMFKRRDGLENPQRDVVREERSALSGVTIDYVTSMMGSGFTFKNPNATGGCGCGSSFSA